MAARIVTSITNNATAPYTIPVRGKTAVRIRSGETVTLDYDIWSMLNSTQIHTISRDIQKGTLSVETSMIAARNKISSMSTADGETLTLGAVDDTKSTKVEKETKPKETTSSAHKPEESEGVHTVGSNGGITIAKGSEKTANMLGAKVAETESFNHQAGTGNHADTSSFVKTSNISGNLNKNTEDVSATGLWNNGKAVTEKTETVATEKVVAEEKAASEELDEKAFATKIDELYELKDYNTMLELLKEKFPDKSFTIASLRALKSWDGIKNKYKLLY